ncbi:PhnD/SsuA/transferrin family substrate-binding protein [Xanthomonas sp. LF07-6]|uniref:PhnD/SsuA/transferrin family substrate-binding protein n=1 Tax=Xanthomonas sp. LF07-6 TaxID=3097550 RepID=UPI002A80DA8E|nr:PhnD/SsuA/transferrin family substrate-binding protein [Xanthomonas sp. LF07-6]MDY4338678.1 PhnD/SsuA/transferrin family substrate-binding protein [Xanthomonas sp. LF07-6]
MSCTFLVAPDFAPEYFGGWYLLSTVLQRRAGIGLRLLMPADAAEQRQLLDDSVVDLVYASPFDASALIRDRGYLPLVRPRGHADEVVIATAAEAPARCVEDLPYGCRIALTANHDVRLIGLRLLEPADLEPERIAWRPASSYAAVARLLLEGEADAGLFLATAYHGLSRLTRARLRPLVESALCDIGHVLLAHPRLGPQLPALRDALLALGDAAHRDDQAMLDALGLERGFEAMATEDAEFMIDLIDTLLD